MNLGSRVVAEVRIVEAGLVVEGKKYVHAKAGEHGTVEHVCEEPGWFVVRWERTGTASQCHSDELSDA